MGVFAIFRQGVDDAQIRAHTLKSAGKSHKSIERISVIGNTGGRVESRAPPGDGADQPVDEGLDRRNRRSHATAHCLGT
jgi:hypothetical protein